MFLFILHAVAVNSYLLYASHSMNNRAVASAFRWSLVAELMKRGRRQVIAYMAVRPRDAMVEVPPINPSRNRKKAKRRAPEARKDGDKDHVPILATNPQTGKKIRRRCVYCCNNRADGERATATPIVTTYCATCLQYLCVYELTKPDCFRLFHSSHE